MDLKADIQAMFDDAKVWYKVGQTQAIAKSTTAGLTLSPTQFSFMGVATGLSDVYEQVRAEVERLLRQAETESDGIGKTLTAIATDFQNNDTAAARKFAGVWVPR